MFQNLKILLAILADLLPLPGPDPDAIRAWLVKMLDSAGKLADLTPTVFDNAGVVVIRSVVESDAAWSLIAELIRQRLNEPDGLCRAVDDKTVSAVSAALPGIDPATIIMIVNLVLELIRAWRDRQ
ncbi:MAG: hypothetical protein ACOY3P_24235 [Planctomycetota bacterium]